ncbi:MAG TPA: hypothetical protein DF292_00880 [Firmicutes bacterium]|jgi:polyferredoxin|nr:hypothetical protein [Bacillota bacterium]HCF93396.1 hypothetical protein [Bacillota bacterium]HCT35579.1 hypothetical protein [Bacillota bacterium]
MTVPRTSKPAATATRKPFPWQKVIQLLALVVFIVLLVVGKNQLWMLLFAAGTILTIFFGRFYCGWLCPMQTIMTAVDGAGRKVRLKKRAIPKWIQHPAVRIVALILFLAPLALTVITGRRLPVLPALVIIAAVLTVFFPAALWHRFLCPFGTILSLPARGTKRFLKINRDSCVSCGVCQVTCPGGAITQDDAGQYTIDQRYCLQCSECRENCAQQSIDFGG